MSIKQTRRSISVRGTTYETLRKYCDSTQRSMSDIVEEQLARLFSGAPQKPAADAGKRPTRTVANRVARVKSEGRPAPTPANDVVPERVRAPKGDYRVIRF
jgi:hypothetical protein